MNNELPTITHVAIKRDDVVYSLPRPNRHHHVLWNVIAKKKTNEENEVQGFLDSDGKFLNRSEAFELASANGQLNRKQGTYNGNLLFSECIW